MSVCPKGAILSAVADFIIDNPIANLTTGYTILTGAGVGIAKAKDALDGEDD